MPFFVFADRSTGRLCGLLDPDLTAWPDAQWAHAQRDDLHTHQGELSEVLVYRNGAIEDKTEADKLADLKGAALARIDAQAESRRALVLTPGVGQMATYQAKEAEAKDYLAATAPALADYPFLAAECLGTGQDASTTAQTIMARASAWRTYGSAVEGARLAAKRAVDQAADETGVQAVLDGIAWPAVPTGA